MELKSKKIEIPTDNPFQYDKLDRKPCAETLTRLIENIPGEFVISINGGWGTGKTTFLKMWEQSLKSQGFRTVFFNAWQDDYCDDALIALIGQLWDALKESDVKEIAQTVKECAIPLVQTTVFNAVRTLSMGIADFDTKDLKSASEKAIDDYLEAGKHLKVLKDRLSELAEKVRTKTDKPLVLIIDELDRCRPTFAIELLEKIKHLFDTSNIIFVLGIDREQLGHSIKSVYGQVMNVDGYLRRFIDLEFLLPLDQKVYIQHIMESYGIKKLRDSYDIDTLSNMTVIFSDWFRMSLRDIEHYMRVLLVAIHASHKEKIAPWLLSSLIAFKIADAEGYREIYSDNYESPEKLIRVILKRDRERKFLYSHDGLILLSHIIAVTDNCPEWERHLTELAQAPSYKTGMPYKELFDGLSSKRAEEIILFLKDIKKEYRQGLGKGLMKHLFSKIELASLVVE